MSRQRGYGPFGYFDGTVPGAEYYDHSLLNGRSMNWVQNNLRPSMGIARSNSYYPSDIPGDGGQFGMLDFSSGQGKWNEIFRGDATRDPSYRPFYEQWGPAGQSGFGELIDGIDGPGYGYRSIPSEWAMADWGATSNSRPMYREPHVPGREGRTVFRTDTGYLGYNAGNGWDYGPSACPHDYYDIADMEYQVAMGGAMPFGYR